MAGKKIAVRMSNIVAGIKKASKQLEKARGIRSSLSPRDQKQLALSIKQLNGARLLVIKACRTRMTAIFIPKGEEVEKGRR